MPKKTTDTAPIQVEVTVTILAGQTTSDAAALFGCCLVGFRTPAVLTGANFSFLAGDSAGTFLPVADTSDAIVSQPVSISRHYRQSPVNFAGIERLKVVSDLPEAADRIITLIVRPV